MSKHCRDCRFAVVRPFIGDYTIDKTGMADYTRLLYGNHVGPVRCKKKQWGVITNFYSARKGMQKVVAETRLIMLKTNKLGLKAETCEFYDDMRDAV